MRAWLEKKLKEKGKVSQILRRMRRGYYGVFKKDYSAQTIAETRQGDCNRCGACCELVYRCPFLGKDAENSPYCRIYGGLRPANCHIYPFDALDSEIEECSYTFIKKD
jgi:hypothetical protein